LGPKILVQCGRSLGQHDARGPQVGPSRTSQLNWTERNGRGAATHWLRSWYHRHLTHPTFVQLAEVVAPRDPIFARTAQTRGFSFRSPVNRSSRSASIESPRHCAIGCPATSRGMKTATVLSFGTISVSSFVDSSMITVQHFVDDWPTLMAFALYPRQPDHLPIH
jgi:hypothetical protein